MKKIFLFFLLLIIFSACNEVDKVLETQLDLNGDWKFRQAGKTAWTKATVPGVVQLDMLRAGLIEDPFYGKNEEKIGWIELENWEYERQFEVSPSLLEQKVVELVFEGLDTYAEVVLNGASILQADNMFCSWRIDCKKHLKVGENTLLVRFRSPIKEKEATYNNLGYQLPAGNDAGEIKVSPFVRKSPYHFGWDWGPRIVTMGIWRPVRLEGYSEVRIEDIYYNQQHVDTAWADVLTQIQLNAVEDQDVEIFVKNGDEILAQQALKLKKGTQQVDLKLGIKQPQLWWSNGLGTPHLYSFNVEVKKAGNVLASQAKKVGLRTIKLIQESDSIGTNYYFKLNGVPVFMKGADYIPQDNLLPRVTVDNYKNMIQNAVDANMNMLRVWGGGIYENDIFYELCDEKGILVWQDFMFACSMYPSDAPFLENVKKEVQQNVERLRNHACIALWCGNNEVDMAWKYWGWQEQYGFSIEDSTTMIEGYKKLFDNLIPTELKALNIQQDYVSTSPMSNWGRIENFDHHSMHYWGVWHGKAPFEEYKTHVGRFMSEYGFQSFPGMETIADFADSSQWSLDSEVMKHHQKSYIGNGMIQQHLEQYFPMPTNFKEFVYLSQLTQAMGIGMAITSHRQDRRCMGTLYWQINDCWPGPSWSSVDYFGRWKALHYEVKKLYQEVLVVLNPLEKNTIEVILVSDKLATTEATLTLELVDFNGKQLWTESKEITIPANDAKAVYKKDFSELLKQYNPKNSYLKATVTYAKGVSQQVHYFAKPKELLLEKSTIQQELKATNEGYELHLKSSTLVKSLQIELLGKKARFSDNYMDLLPNEELVIRIKTNEKLTKVDLSFMYLNQLK